jgi:O-succinylbenzoic acid--CoA ligase
VCVIGLCDRTWGEAVTAVYVPNSKVTTAQIKEVIAGKLSKFKQPKNWICLEKLPRNLQGKSTGKNYINIATEFLQQSPS